MNKTEHFIERAKKKHGDKYDYSKVELTNVRHSVVIICPEHGEFKQSAYIHTDGSGCGLCAIKKNVNDSTLGLDKFIAKSRIKHGDKFDYTKSVYVSSKKSLIITCPVHGDISISPNSHYKSPYGCQQCYSDDIEFQLRMTTEEFIEKSRLIWGSKFDYSKVIYAGNKSKVIIICDLGHEFTQIPNDHLGGHGCNICSLSLTTSSYEVEMLDFIKSCYNGEILENIRSIISPLELDVYLPSLNLAIEFNGLYRHSERFKNKDYHLIKWKMCSNLGLRLVHIWENEWIDQRELCEAFIRSIIASSSKMYARKLEIRSVSVKDQRDFLIKYHFQGYVGATICLGLYNDDELLQMMSLKRLDNLNNYEIGRLCTKSGYSIVGGSERLFKNLLKDITYSSIISYNNLDKFTGEVYSRLGMKLDRERVESYWYTKNQKIFSRQQFQKHKLVSQGHDESMTEHKIANSTGFYRVYPTGSSRYILQK